MQSLHRWPALTLLALWMATGLGCGNSAPKLVPVSGMLVNGDKPIGSATIVFASDNSKGGRNYDAYSQTNAQGKFTLVTAQLGKGAVVGHYKVAITTDGPNRLIPAKFNSFDTTPIRVEIKDGGDENLRLDLGKS